MLTTYQKSIASETRSLDTEHLLRETWWTLRVLDTAQGKRKRKDLHDMKSSSIYDSYKLEVEA